MCAIPDRLSICEKSADMHNACDQCSAVCYAETGAFTGVPQYMCARTQAYLKQAQAWLAAHPAEKEM